MRLATDHSDMPLWSLPSLPVLCIIGAFLFLGAVTLIWAERNTPITDEDTSGLDQLDGLTEGQPACHSSGPRGGHYVRAAGSWWVCPACGETWPMGGVEPYDQEAS